MTDLAEVADQNPRARHAAPGQYLGFAIQPVRLCFHLLTCPRGARVSLEHLDDVAIHFEDGSVLLEQDKSALSQNPISDWSLDLWKCLANWLGALKLGLYQVEKAEFCLYVSPVRRGRFAQFLSEATTREQVEAATSKIRNSLNRLRTSPACISFLQRFLDVTTDERFAIISRFKIISVDADPVEPIRALLKPTVAQPLIDPLCQFAIGRAKEIADSLIRGGEPANLDGDKFKAEFRSFVQKNNLPNLLTSFTQAPSPGEVSSILATSPIFIRQLDLVEVSQDERVRAASDFLRASADKSCWAEAGLIFKNDLKEWDDELVRRCGLIHGEVIDIHQDKAPSVQGRIAYRRCAQIQPSLEGRVVPGHFVHGCLNSLADLKEIGWHPDYKHLLAEEE